MINVPIFPWARPFIIFIFLFNRIALVLPLALTTSKTSGGLLVQQIRQENVLNSLDSGKWVKFICGASNQDSPLIRNMCLVYTLAGVDCIDVCADVAVVEAADQGIRAALRWQERTREECRPRPYLMISVNDAEDLHFRKAFFNPQQCPSDCPRPCERACPAWAIPPLLVAADSTTASIKKNTQRAHISLPTHSSFEQHSRTQKSSSNIQSLSQLLSKTSAGVIADKCYGCGRCIPVCPLSLIKAESYISSHADVTSLLSSSLVDAIEIHTHRNHDAAFSALWSAIGPIVLKHTKLIAVSFPDMGDETLPYLNRLQSIMMGSIECGIADAEPRAAQFNGVQIWQADGRPMSGDIGRGTAHAAAKLAAAMIRASNSTSTYSIPSSSTISSKNGASRSSCDPYHPPPIGAAGKGIVAKAAISSNSNDSFLATVVNIESNNRYIDFNSGRHFLQLAGGTNDHSMHAARWEGLVGAKGFGGLAFGGYARRSIGEQLNALESRAPGARLEDHPECLDACLQFAQKLVASVKEPPSAVSSVENLL